MHDFISFNFSSFISVHICRFVRSLPLCDSHRHLVHPVVVRIRGIYIRPVQGWNGRRSAWSRCQ